MSWCQRIGEGGLQLPRQMGIHLGGAGAAVPEVLLDDPEVHPRFQQMGGVGVPQRMDVGPLGDPGPQEGPPEGALEAAPSDRAPVVREGVRQPVTGRRGEEPHRGAVGAPVRAEALQRGRRQGHVPVLLPLAVDVEQHPGAVHSRDLQVRAFEQPQPAGVDGGQADAVDRDARLGQDPPDLLPAQDDGQLVLPRGADEPEGGPIPLQRALVEELDPAACARRRGPGHLLLVGKVEEILAQVLLSEPGGTGVVVRGELADGGDVALLGAGGEPPELQVLDHPLA